MNKNFYKLLSFCLVIIGIIIIFLFSSMDATESNSKSKQIINKAITKSAEVSNDLGVTNVNTESQKKIAIVNKLNPPLRKCMHASVYFILDLLLCSFINSLNLENEYLKYILSVIVVFLYACTDEYHQTFVTGRSGEFRDVLIDTLGGIIACIFVVIMNHIFKAIRGKKNV